MRRQVSSIARWMASMISREVNSLISSPFRSLPSEPDRELRTAHAALARQQAPVRHRHYRRSSRHPPEADKDGANCANPPNTGAPRSHREPGARLAQRVALRDPAPPGAKAATEKAMSPASRSPSDAGRIPHVNAPRRSFRKRNFARLVPSFSFFRSSADPRR